MPHVHAVTILHHWADEEAVSLEHALERGRRALAAVSGGAPAQIYAAALSGEARALGAWQREQDALSDVARGRHPIHRRRTGGPAARAGEGVTYLALALADASVLMECPPDRVLNRNVRGLLGGLRAFGGAAHYFGREVLTLDRRPAVLVGWHRGLAGAVLLEAFYAARRPWLIDDAELAHRAETPRLLGKEPTTLEEALSEVPDAASLADATARACAKLGGLEPRRAPMPDVAPVAAALGPPSELIWSRPREIPIGWVRAGLRLDPRGVVEAAALAGDFFQDAGAPDRLTNALVGGEPRAERLRDALNATYGRHGLVIEGLRSLQPVLEAFIELGPERG